MGHNGYVHKQTARTRMLQRWRVNVIDIPTLFRNFNMDAPIGTNAKRLTHAALRCLDMDTNRRDYHITFSDDFVRIEFHDGGFIECQKLRH